MSGFWSAIEDKKSSKTSWGKLAYGQTSQYEKSKFDCARSRLNCYQPSEGCDPYHLNSNDYAHMYQSAQYENEHFHSNPPAYSTSLNFLNSRHDTLEAHEYGEFVAPKSSNHVEVRICALCDSPRHLSEHCPELHAFGQPRVDHDNTFYQMQESTFYSQTCDEEYIDDPYCLSPCMQALEENLTLINQNLAQIKLDLMNASQIDPNSLNSSYVQNDISNETNPLLKDMLNMSQIGNIEPHVEYECEMYDFSIESTSDSSVFYPSLAHDNEYLPMLEEDVETVNTSTFDRMNSPYLWDDDDGTLLEEVVNDISEFYNSETLDHNVETSTDSVCFELHPLQSCCMPDGLGDNFFDACENNALVVCDSGKGELSNDIHDFVKENEVDVSISPPMSRNNGLTSNLESVHTMIVRPIVLQVPNLGLELCASQVLLDYFASKFSYIEKPHVESIHVSLPVPKQVQICLTLVYDAPLTLRDFVSKSLYVERFRSGGSSLKVSLALLSCSVCVRPLKALHVVFWVDPQLFRLLVYGESFWLIQ